MLLHGNFSLGLQRQTTTTDFSELFSYEYASSAVRQKRCIFFAIFAIYSFKVIASFSLFGFQFFFFFCLFCLFLFCFLFLFLFWRNITFNQGLNIFWKVTEKDAAYFNLNTGPTTMIIIMHLKSCAISTICSWGVFFIIRSIYKSIKV